MEKLAGAYSVGLDISAADFDADFAENILKRLLLLIARKVESHPSAIAGHIKAYCTGLEKDYLKASYTSARQGVQVSGEWRHSPEIIQVSLNVIVLKMSWRDLLRITHLAVDQVEQSYEVSISPCLSIMDKEKLC